MAQPSMVVVWADAGVERTAKGAVTKTIDALRTPVATTRPRLARVRLPGPGHPTSQIGVPRPPSHHGSPFASDCPDAIGTLRVASQGSRAHLNTSGPLALLARAQDLHIKRAQSL